MKTQPIKLDDFLVWIGGSERPRWILFCLCAALQVMPAFSAPIRNVIILIGDGMGTGQVAAAHCYAGTNLVFEATTNRSLVSTLSAYGVWTDSAAAATALATGHKVYNGVVSLASPGGGGELETLVERYRNLGKSTGLVTSSYLTDSTPASFGAHTSNRMNYADIASDYLGQTRPNLLFGGGGNCLCAEAAQAAGYRVVTNAAEMAALRGEEDYVAGLFGNNMLPYECDGLGGLPSLAQMTAKALGLLSRDPDGFFLMVEGGLIDYACHNSDLYRCVTETLAFNEAVRLVVAWAQGRNDTLVIVTADHETGGLAVLADNGSGVLPTVAWQFWGLHTTARVGVYGFGVNAERVIQKTENTDVWSVVCSEALMPATGCGVELGPGAAVHTRWAVNSGDVCRLEFALSLTSPTWQPNGTVTAENARVEWVITNQAANGSGFFRVQTLSATGVE